MTTRLPQAFRSHRLRVLVCALAGLVIAVTAGSAQTAKSLPQAKKIYVDSLGNEKAADAIRARIISRLRVSRKLQIVSSGAEADAVLRGTIQIWTTGYISLSVHPSRANKQPEFDGYLSAELQGKDDATLWSYLVTPSKFSVKRITDDLADQLVQRFLDAIEHGAQEMQPAKISETSAPVAIHGAGATFPWPIYQKWFESYQRRLPSVHIDYDPVGSESGIRQLTEGSIDFAGSDMPLSDQAMAESKVKLLHFASVLGAVVPIYNLQNMKQSLNFTPEVLAGIYLGAIRRWNDPIIRAANPGVPLPNSEIVVVHRSDGSGTTFAWADYLFKTSSAWKDRVGAPATIISWPVGRGGERNDGVAALVRQIPNSIGYVELTYAIQHEIRFGAVRNAAGNFVKADLASVTAAAAEIAENTGSDFRLSITNAPGKSAYPIATFTWLLLPAENSPASKRAAVIDFLRWVLTAGQKQCSGLGYAPLPPLVANKELQILSGLN